MKELKNFSNINDAKPMLNDGFIIDFFELMFLAESVIPERPIARSMCFDDFSERHYHKMNDNQRMGINEGGVEMLLSHNLLITVSGYMQCDSNNKTLI